MPKCFLVKDTKQLDKVMALLIGYRISQGLTQTQVADEIGVSQPTVSNWEKKEVLINLEQFFDYCKVLNVKPKDLFD